MRNTVTFKQGGVHPPGRKTSTNANAIHNAVLPSIATIPLHQHIGSCTECLVEKGDEVREGMPIGKITGFVSAAVHSSIPGTVMEIVDVVLPNGLTSKSVRVELKGEFDRLGKRQNSVDWRTFTSEELLSKLQEQGVVGMGGATFPTHVKYSIPKGSKAELFVINGVECEPYLSGDHRIMLERAPDLFEAIRIVKSILKPERIVFAIEDNKPDAISLLTDFAAANEPDIEVCALEVKYPQGDEKQILKALTGKEVPSGGLPINIGAVVSNVSTMLSIFEAIVLEKPVIERTLTVSGGGIENPGNYKVRIGTPIRQLIEECGGFSGKVEKVVSGGPMMGFTVHDLDTPVTKGTSGILALTPKEVRGARTCTCIACGGCISVCPLGLNPTKLFKLVDHMEINAAIAEGLMDCKECGCCAYACPSHIPLVQGMRLGKRLHVKKQRS